MLMCLLPQYSMTIAPLATPLLIKKEKSMIAQPNRVTIANGPSFLPSFGWVFMADFMTAVSRKLKKNTTAFGKLQSYLCPAQHACLSDGRMMNPYGSNILFFKHIQNMLDGETTVIAETGDLWFNCQKLRLPENCGYEFQMQYGFIGWSVGATLGYAQAAKEKLVIAFVGVGSFQVTAQDVWTMIRHGQRSIVFLINNGGYTIEVEIHDGPYNVIKNWNYTGLVDAINNSEGRCWSCRVSTEEDLEEAIAKAPGEKKDCLCFIEVIVHKNDASKELVGWGS